MYPLTISTKVVEIFYSSTVSVDPFSNKELSFPLYLIQSDIKKTPCIMLYFPHNSKKNKIFVLSFELCYDL